MERGERAGRVENWLHVGDRLRGGLLGMNGVVREKSTRRYQGTKRRKESVGGGNGSENLI